MSALGIKPGIRANQYIAIRSKVSTTLSINLSNLRAILSAQLLGFYLFLNIPSFVLRQNAIRAALSVAKPNPSVIVPKARTFVSLNKSRLRPASRWAVSPLQRRFVSESAVKEEKVVSNTSEPEVATAESTTSEKVESNTSEPQVATAESTTSEKVESNTSEPQVATAESRTSEKTAEELEPEVAPEATARTTEETSTSMDNTTQAPEPDAPNTVSASAIADAISSATSGEASNATAGQSDQAPESSAVPSPNKIIYVGNVFFDVNDQALNDYFARFGPIKSAKISRDARGLSRGFGHVEFENLDDAARAVEFSNQQIFQGRRLAVQFHRPRMPVTGRQKTELNPPSKTLFIGNMSFEMSDKDLSDLFREVRNVIDVRIAIDRRTGAPRGFAHADFLDVASATKAMEILKNKTIYGRTLKVDYGMPSSSSRSPLRD
ncbi:uncharacterized protein PV09_01552 [Verruconis gallopava]|uniref:RRM domain-containing protein n=1 Tax=Verruconis gallopava TaxID=253628 RepID=A0A0D1XXU4_9PEZI|nr:uncharacterized protein PV09_01552 [Verruconis gallopava]KIW07601.1 hypothetical protein PV09_01552 [Verruconis gallopava]